MLRKIFARRKIIRWIHLELSPIFDISVPNCVSSIAFQYFLIFSLSIFLTLCAFISPTNCIQKCIQTICPSTIKTKKLNTHTHTSDHHESNQSYELVEHSLKNQISIKSMSKEENETSIAVILFRNKPKTNWFQW